MKTSKLLAVLLVIVVSTAILLTFFYQVQEASANDVRVACVGDSITSDTKYTEILSKMLGANYTVGNFGVGRTTVSRQFEKPYVSQQAFQDAQRFNPDIIVIMLGTNDAYLNEQQRSNFTSDYKTLIATFQKLPSNPKIYIVVPPPVFNNTMGLPAAILDNQVVPLVNQTATDLRLPTIDVHTTLINNPEDFYDGVHPNNEGSQVIASEVYNAITP